MFSDSLRRAPPEWLVDEPYEDVPRGTLKSGKEAEIFLVERRFVRSTRLLAHKRYRPRYPAKGELRARGFSNSTRYRGDAIYKAGWHLPSRDKRAVMGGSRFGHELAARLWPLQEWSVLCRAWDAGVSVPYPVQQTDHGLLMEFIGDDTRAAPKLVEAKLALSEVRSSWAQLMDSLRCLTGAGLVHADLSVYNLLWWDGRLFMIDLPQAVGFTTNSDAYELLHRDLTNVAAWFERRGVVVDVEEVYGQLLTLAM